MPEPATGCTNEESGAQRPPAPHCAAPAGARREGQESVEQVTLCGWTLCRVGQGPRRLGTCPGPCLQGVSDSPVILGWVNVSGREDIERQDVGVDQGLVSLWSVSDAACRKGNGAQVTSQGAGDPGPCWLPQVRVLSASQLLTWSLKHWSEAVPGGTGRPCRVLGDPGAMCSYCSTVFLVCLSATVNTPVHKLTNAGA